MSQTSLRMSSSSGRGTAEASRRSSVPRSISPADGPRRASSQAAGKARRRLRRLSFFDIVLASCCDAYSAACPATVPDPARRRSKYSRPEPSAIPRRLLLSSSPANAPAPGAGSSMPPPRGPGTAGEAPAAQNSPAFVATLFSVSWRYGHPCHVLEFISLPL
ncbi:hypothetical protein PtA15_7A338 [Puccinia triticina]|uniref:Uncharacterized protein n=1 Tax=Puccinia triticina TaxID=208348 RepID=A0ABY7CRM2_9BASI|nr:uncharacterized protein PtA15_7A338 [Puccinia triticina]WAQ86612.1 hypothetical protein PtA15_7A338 [Puccinia triticina]WAR56473.1 hypothetical protein PtB15_7B322 [Puccinia triticina]